MYKKILLGLGLLWTSLSSVVCKAPAPTNYDIAMAMNARNNNVAEYTISEKEQKKPFKIEAEKIRGTTAAYEANYLKLKRIGDDSEKKSALEEAIKKQETVIKKHLKDYEHNIAVVMEVTGPDGHKKSYGTTYELNFVGKVTLDDLKDLVESNTHTQYAPLVQLHNGFKKYENGDPVKKYAFEINLEGTDKKVKFYQLVKDKDGLLSYKEITPDQIKAWTDGKKENGEISKLGVQVYIAGEVAKPQTQTTQTQTTPTLTAKTTKTTTSGVKRVDDN